MVEHAGLGGSWIECFAVRDPWAERHLVQDGDVWAIDFDSTEEVGPGGVTEREAVGELTGGKFQTELLCPIALAKCDELLLPNHCIQRAR